jgi:hypothetical protein
MRSNVTVTYRASLKKTGRMFEQTLKTTISNRKMYTKEIIDLSEGEGFPVENVKILSVSLGWKNGKK